MDLILRNARVIGNEGVTTDIGIDKGRIAVIEPGLAAEGETLDLGGCLVTPGFRRFSATVSALRRSSMPSSISVDVL